MNRIILVLIVLLNFSDIFGQYYYFPYKNEGSNPNKLNKDAESPYPNIPAGWLNIWTDDESGKVVYTAKQTIPFSYKFNDSNVTEYKVSNAGFVTFSTTSTKNLAAFSNVSLPDANIPNNTICVLGMNPQTNAGNKSTILTKTFGKAPNRQHWIQFNYFGEKNILNGWTYWCIVLEESTNMIYIVDMRTLCVISGTVLCGNNVELSAGIQINNSTANAIAESPTLGAGNQYSDISDTSDNSYYAFIQGKQALNDLAGMKVIVADYLAPLNTPFTIAGIFKNMGTQTVTKFDFAYKINNETPVVSSINSNIALISSVAFSHPITWTPTVEGTYKIAIWPASVNGTKDELSINDTVFKLVNVVAKKVERKTLNEVFTSSTCLPCTKGNMNVDTLFPQRAGKLTVIKYQLDFPSPGDPYTTDEIVNRYKYFYKIGYIPYIVIDGGFNGSSLAFTLNVFDQFQTEPSFMILEAKHQLKANTISVDVNITPLITINDSNLKLFIAICEKKTFDNIKNNGETEFEHVLKKMLPNENGTFIGSLVKNVTMNMPRQSFTFSGNYRLPIDGQALNRINLYTEHSVEDFSNLEVVVFIQNTVTKKVYQSEYSISSVLGISQPESNKCNPVIYPNPCKGIATLQFHLEKPEQVNISLYNSIGQLLKVIDSNCFDNSINTVELNTTGLKEGLYFVTLKIGDITTTHKLIVEE